MTQSQLFEPNYMGEFLRDYKPPLISLNRTINSVFTRPVKLTPYAVITQEVQFPDVSFYQKDVDYLAMKLHTNAIIIRAGQNRWVDVQFERNYAEAKANGLLVGAYWFYDGRVSPGEQANLLISLLRDKKLEMEVFIDWERNFGGKWEGLANVVAMMQAVESAGLNIKGVGLYTGYFFFRSNSNAITNASQYNYLKNKPLWLAWYTNNAGNVLIPAPWISLTHWQFGTPVVEWGQQTSELDMNFFNGSKQNFSERYGGSTQPMIYNYRVTPDFSDGSKLRAGHGTTSTQIGALAFNKKAWGNERWGDGTVEDWIRIIEYENNQGGISFLDAWIALRSGGRKVATLTILQTPPPPDPNPEPEVPTLTHTIEVFSDGSIKVDGKTYP